MEGGYTDLFELICPQCGDHPYLDYSEISPRLQRIRGPDTLDAGVAAYEKHLGVAPDKPATRQAQALCRAGQPVLAASAGRPAVGSPRRPGL
jgi:hypothetical protein